MVENLAATASYPAFRGPVLSRCLYARALRLKACVSTGDTILRSANGATVECQNGCATILPSYAEREVLQVGNLRLDILIKEITDEGEFAAYQASSINKTEHQ